MSVTDMKTILAASAGVPIDENIALSAHTSFGIGGPAALFAVAKDTEILARLLSTARNHAVEVLIVGGGTNLLVSDDGFDGLAIRLDLTRLEIDTASGRVTAEAGVPTAALVERTVDAGLRGLAFAAGLPGTVGGALAGNAGCFGQCLSDPLFAAVLVSRTGEIVHMTDKGWFDFRYRHSKLLRSGHVLTEATFCLDHGSRERLTAEAQKNISLRREKHPAPGLHTAGSYFKNLPPLTPGEHRRAAGMLLEQVGAKGLQVGGAAVFEKHANIIVNRGGATARDVLSLASEMQRRVKERFGVFLEPEVRFVGRKPEGF